MGLQVAALSASLVHTFIDSHIGLFGPTSTDMTLLQAANVVTTCLVIGWWAICLGASVTGTRSGLHGAFTLVIVWALLANGAAAAAVAPPPSAAFPYQDIAHFSSLILGAAAAWTTWLEIKRTRAATYWPCVGVAVVLMLAAFVLQGVLGIMNV